MSKEALISKYTWEKQGALMDEHGLKESVVLLAGTFLYFLGGKAYGVANSISSVRIWLLLIVFCIYGS